MISQYATSNHHNSLIYITLKNKVYLKFVKIGACCEIGYSYCFNFEFPTKCYRNTKGVWYYI